MGAIGGNRGCRRDIEDDGSSSDSNDEVEEDEEEGVKGCQRVVYMQGHAGCTQGSRLIKQSQGCK